MFEKNVLFFFIIVGEDVVMLMQKVGVQVYFVMIIFDKDLWVVDVVMGYDFVWVEKVFNFFGVQLLVLIK